MNIPSVSQVSFDFTAAAGASMSFWLGQKVLPRPAAAVDQPNADIVSAPDLIANLFARTEDPASGGWYFINQSSDAATIVETTGEDVTIFGAAQPLVSDRLHATDVTFWLGDDRAAATAPAPETFILNAATQQIATSRFRLADNTLITAIHGDGFGDETLLGAGRLGVALAAADPEMIRMFINQRHGGFLDLTGPSRPAPAFAAPEEAAIILRDNTIVRLTGLFGGLSRKLAGAGELLGQPAFSYGV